MKNRNEWPKSVILGYIGSVVMYLSIAIFTYSVYGNALGNHNTVLDAIEHYNSSTKIATKVALAIMVLHVLMAFPVVMNPIFLLVKWDSEQYFY